MIFRHVEHDCEQGSEEWLALRLGLATASNAERILTPKQRKLSAATGYLDEKLVEWLFGTPIDDAKSGFMDRGSELEPEARAWYSLTRGVEVREVGFVTLHNGDGPAICGCSPDGLVGDDGGIEIKTLGAKAHVRALLDGALEYGATQVQACLWVTGRKWWDLIAYHPTLPKLVIRVERDEEWIEQIAAGIDEFNARLADAKARLTELGCEPLTAGKYCRAVVNGNYCFGRRGLVEVDGSWRCERHAGKDDVAPSREAGLGVSLEVAAASGGFSQGEFNAEN